jgi:hypothetical protein
MSNKKTTMMTPQQKAKDLIDKFTLVGLQQRNEGVQCALIHVNELIAEMRDNELNFQIKTPHGVFVFWDVVKHEIKQKQ